MTRYLVLADQPIDGDRASTEFRRMAATRGSSFHVVVPLVELDDEARRVVEIEEEPNEAAVTPEVVASKWRLREAMSTLEALGSDVTGSLGVESPVESIEQALDADDYDVVVVVTDPAGIAGWVKMDLASRIERHVSEPVVTIEVDHVANR